MKLLFSFMAVVLGFGTLFSQITFPEYEKFRATYNFQSGITEGSLERATTDVVKSYKDQNYVVVADYDCFFADISQAPNGNHNEQVIKVIEVDEEGVIQDETALLIMPSVAFNPYPAGEYNKVVRIIKGTGPFDSYYVLFNYVNDVGQVVQFGVARLDIDLNLVWSKSYNFATLMGTNVTTTDYMMRGLQLMETDDNERLAILFEFTDYSNNMLGILEVEESTGNFANSILIEPTADRDFNLFGDYAADFMAYDGISEYVIGCTSHSTVTFIPEATIIRADMVMHNHTSRYLSIPGYNGVYIASIIGLDVSYIALSPGNDDKGDPQPGMPARVVSNFYLAGTALLNTGSVALILEVPENILTGAPTVLCNYTTHKAGAEGSTNGFFEVHKASALNGMLPQIGVYAIGQVRDQTGMRALIGGAQEEYSIPFYYDNSILERSFTMEYETSDESPMNMIGFHTDGDDDDLSHVCVGRLDNSIHVQRTGVHKDYLSSGFDFGSCDDNTQGEHGSHEETTGMDLQILEVMHNMGDMPNSVSAVDLPFIREDKCYEIQGIQIYTTTPPGISCTGMGVTEEVFVGLQGSVPSNSNVVLYPNPTSGLLHIESTETIRNLHIYNTSAQRVDIDMNLSNGEQVLDVNKLVPGLYRAVFTTDTGYSTLSFLKK